jgi:hypothetical protein
MLLLRIHKLIIYLIYLIILISSLSIISENNINYINLKKNKNNKIAFAITITNYNKYILDGAAVAGYSVIKSMKSSIYETELVAFVHSNVSNYIPTLIKLGYKVLKKDIPIDVNEIKRKYLRDTIKKSGCCGASELIKLYAWTLTQYYKVVHMDIDFLQLKNIDELLSKNKSLIYTIDVPMSTSYSKLGPLQGGFFIVRPSITDFQNMINIVIEGDFRDSTGWGGTNIGWYWGGQTIQGLVPYYYSTKFNEYETVDRCIYNNMADTVLCRNKSISEISSAHFTVCQKPWTCQKQSGDSLCKNLHSKWFDIRKEAEMFYNISVIHNPCSQDYKTMDLY